MAEKDTNLNGGSHTHLSETQVEKAVGAIHFLSSLSLPSGERSNDNAEDESQSTESAAPSSKAKPAGMYILYLLLSFAMITCL